MAPYKPDFIVANCPGCAMFIDKWQYTIAEMEGRTTARTGTAFRCSPTRRWPDWCSATIRGLGMQMHQVDVEPLLDKMGIEYDPAAKYLGMNGKYIGQPASAIVNCGSQDTVYNIKQ